MGKRGRGLNRAEKKVDSSKTHTGRWPPTSHSWWLSSECSRQHRAWLGQPAPPAGSNLPAWRSVTARKVTVNTETINVHALAFPPLPASLPGCNITETPISTCLCLANKPSLSLALSFVLLVKKKIKIIKAVQWAQADGMNKCRPQQRIVFYSCAKISHLMHLVQRGMPTITYKHLDGKKKKRQLKGKAVNWGSWKTNSIHSIGHCCRKA